MPRRRTRRNPRSNPPVNQRTDLVARKAKYLKQIANTMKFEGIVQGTPDQVLRALVSADPTGPSHRKYGEWDAKQQAATYQFLPWILDMWKKNPSEFMTDLNKVSEYLSVLAYHQKKSPWPRWANVQVNAKRFPTVPSLFRYLTDSGAIRREELSGKELYERIMEMQGSGDVQILIQTDDIIIVDELSEAAACSLGAGTEWCTAEGAYHSYSQGGLLMILWFHAPDKYDRVQFKADFGEQKDVDNEEIDWEEYPFNEWYDDAQEAAKIVEKRLDFTKKNPLTYYSLVKMTMENKYTKAAQEVAEWYGSSKAFPVDWMRASKTNLELIVNFYDATTFAAGEKLVARLAPHVLLGEIYKELCVLNTPWAGHYIQHYPGAPTSKKNPLSEGHLDFDLRGRQRGKKQDLVSMVDIPKGTYKFQERKVQLRGFEIGKYEVTVGVWLWVMKKPPEGVSIKDVGKLNFPVTHVSWYDCIRFCNELSKMDGKEPCYTIKGEAVTWKWDADGYRLPTEAEWEAAAHGGQNFKYAGSNDIDEVAWYYDNSDNRVHPVGQLKPNGYGLYDMSGNVSEWVYDTYTRDPYDKEEMPD